MTRWETMPALRMFLPAFHDSDTGTTRAEYRQSAYLNIVT